MELTLINIFCVYTPLFKYCCTFARASSLYISGTESSKSNMSASVLKFIALSRNLSLFESYIKAPVPSTILVFCYKGKKIDKRKSVGKLLSKNKFVLDFEPIKDYQLPDWIINCASENKIKFDRRVEDSFTQFFNDDERKIIECRVATAVPHSLHNKRMKLP